MLAVARRPLTSEELAYAVFIDPEDDDLTTISELDGITHAVGLLDLIRPFISTTSIGDGKDLQVRLIHQSLKELILRSKPSNWTVPAKPTRGSNVVERKTELDGALLRRCIKYLLLDECGEKDLFSGFENVPEDVEFLAIGDVFEDDAPETESPPSDSPQDFNPSDLGFGGFFTYAASFWTTHFFNVPETLLLDPKDLIALCSHGSRRLKNWVEQWQRPNCSYRIEVYFHDEMPRLDPLVVTAIFGSAASMADMMKCNLQTPDFLPDSVWIAIEHLIKQGAISTVRDMLKDQNIKSTLCCTTFFYTVLFGWANPIHLRSSTAKEWEDIFDFLIKELHDDLLIEGNEILCQAARNGCFVLVKKLFEAAELDPEFKRAILAEDRWKFKGRAKWLGTHQSVGEAAYEGHTNIVRFLCQQAGIEPHLRHKNHQGQTVFHQAARRGDTEIFRILIQHWPEGINLKNKGNDSPLVDLIFNKAHGDLETARTVRVLISEGKADTTGLNDEPGFSPLSTALRMSNVPVCKILITEGSADVSCVMEIEAETGIPSLKDRVREEEKMLKTLCSLFPLAVSTEYLFWDTDGDWEGA